MTPAVYQTHPTSTSNGIPAKYNRCKRSAIGAISMAMHPKIPPTMGTSETCGSFGLRVWTNQHQKLNPANIRNNSPASPVNVHRMMSIIIIFVPLTSRLCRGESQSTTSYFPRLAAAAAGGSHSSDPLSFFWHLLRMARMSVATSQMPAVQTRISRTNSTGQSYIQWPW